MNKPAWIAVDWGTSHLRAWLMSAEDKVLSARHSDAGMAGLAKSDFAGALNALVGPYDGPVIACGMVGSRQGWAEAPYETVPCAPPSARNATRIAHVQILPGVKQQQPADVMRGEETQISGFLATHADFEGVLCLPGTHTKWVHVSAGEIVSFRTAMTGELFALLSQKSILRHTVGDGWDKIAFETAVGDAISRPEAMAAQLFNIRAMGLLQGHAPDFARARLSGLLIGAELASMRPYWLGQTVALIGARDLSEAYAAALSMQGIVAQVTDAEAMTLAGLIAAKAALEVT